VALMAGIDKTVRLDDDHGWRSKPDYQIFVADRGAVRFDFPVDWVVEVDSDGIRIHDRPPPDDDCRLQVTVFYLPEGIDFTDLPVAKLLAAALNDRDREIISQDPISHLLRPGYDIVWTEVQWTDPNEQREARSRHCLARAGTIQAFLTLDFWPEDAKRVKPVWKEVLRSLRLGEYVASPEQGPRR
jgi:hypothetical protein